MCNTIMIFSTEPISTLQKKGGLPKNMFCFKQNWEKYIHLKRECVLKLINIIQSIKKENHYRYTV